jgi:hypothetical protein
MHCAYTFPSPLHWADAFASLLTGLSLRAAAAPTDFVAANAMRDAARCDDREKRKGSGEFLKVANASQNGVPRTRMKDVRSDPGPTLSQQQTRSRAI